MEIQRQPVDNLSGIGPQTALKLQKLGVHCVQDLLFLLPHRYEDRTRVHPIGSLTAGMSALIVGTVELSDVLPKGRRSLICRIGDQTGFINLRFFHFSANQQAQLKPGTQVCCFGEIRHGYAGLEIIHPEYKIIHSRENVTEDSLTPIYPLTEGLRQNTLRKAVKQALHLCLPHLTDWLPAPILQRHKFPALAQALRTLHCPQPNLSSHDIQQSSSLKRLAFEEFLAHHLRMLQNKLRQKQWRAPVLQADEGYKKRFLASLPFRLTKAQRRVIGEIETDCANNHPMLRLVQGDVGSGKTVVAAYNALLALASDFQVAVMAPTELLAEQHLRNFSQWFAGFDCAPVFLTGQLKGKARQQTLESIADGSAKLVIGTHALFQESVHFAKLGLVVIDEQHRFGVHQRLALREKSQPTGLRPHQLIMTATPIPRTLAMLQYSDLDLSIIDELPPGRKPITTSVIPSERRDEVIARIRHWIEKKHQAYWVCTLIEESEALQCEAAEKTADYLRDALPDVRIALVHGRMKAADKDGVMQAFKRHESDLLVATTVIEVGVDVPNAGLMIIENPERLGLSQLHQLRGRIGRGDVESYCLLLYQSPLSESGRERLKVFRDNHDGFVIAEMDLKMRGMGEIMGTRQTGQVQFKIADLNRDKEQLERVQQAAELICKDHPEAIQPLIDRWLGDAGRYAEV